MDTNIGEKLEKLMEKKYDNPLIQTYAIYLWERNILRNKSNTFKSILRIGYTFFKNFFKSSKLDNEKYDIAFYSFLDREGDLGLILPIIKKIKDLKIICFFSEECMKSEKLKKIKNSNIKIRNIKEYKAKISIRDLILILKKIRVYYRKLKEVDSKLKKEKWIYISLIFSYYINAYQLRKKTPNINLYFSLGDPLVKIIAGNKKVIAMQHGFLWDYNPHYPWFYKFNTDEVYIFGKKYKSLSKQYKKVVFKVKGSPNYDYIKNEFSPMTKKEKLTICFFSNLGDRSELLYKICEFLNEISTLKINIILKLHPNEGEEVYLKYKKYLNKNIYIENCKKIKEMLKDIDIAITIDSTSNIELLLNNKITCQYIPNNLTENIIIGRQNFSELISTSSDLERFLLSLKDEKTFSKILDGQKKILEEEYLENIGNSANMIYEELLKEFRGKNE